MTGVTAFWLLAAWTAFDVAVISMWIVLCKVAREEW